MNRPFQISQRFVLASLLIAIIITAMVAPRIIDFYTGAPRLRAPDVSGGQAITTAPGATQNPGKGESFILGHPTQTLSPRPPSPRNCTVPIEYWRTHPDSWPSQGMTFGRLVLDKETALAVINTAPDEVRMIVLQELIVYSLNSLHGADPSPVLATVKELGAWLEAYGSAGAIPEADRQRGLALAAALQAFNSGQTGPGVCPETTDTPTPTITITPSPTLSPTASPTSTSPAPTRRPPPIPTATDRPNPPNPRPQPTAVPTDPPPPTAAPTEPPPPTAAPTEPPPPTAVPTSVPTPTSPP